MKIEKGVPLPQRGSAKSGKLTLALQEMEMGDSVVVTDRTTDQIANTLWREGRLLGRRFTQRRVDGGQRVWRVE